MNEHEIYPSAPVVLVVLEVRHPSAETIGKAERNLLKRELAKRTPIMKSAQAVSFQIQAGVIGAAPSLNVEEFPKYFNRDTTLSVSFKQQSIVIEASSYAGWENFRDVARLAFDARASLDPVDGVERVGLRFINELRVPQDPPNWRAWVRDGLFEPQFDDLAEMPLNQWQGLVVYGNEPGQSLALRYGPREGVTTVEPNPDLKRPKGPGGPFFLLDLDSYWLPEDGTPEFDPKKLEQICDDLHSPVRRMFEGLVTQRLRDEVLRK